MTARVQRRCLPTCLCLLSHLASNRSVDQTFRTCGPGRSDFFRNMTPAYLYCQTYPIPNDIVKNILAEGVKGDMCHLPPTQVAGSHFPPIRWWEVPHVDTCRVPLAARHKRRGLTWRHEHFLPCGLAGCHFPPCGLAGGHVSLRWLPIRVNLTISLGRVL